MGISNFWVIICLGHEFKSPTLVFTVLLYQPLELGALSAVFTMFAVTTLFVTMMANMVDNIISLLALSDIFQV